MIIEKDRLSDRLIIYLSIFTFAPLFQPLLPYHTLLTLPEYLLVNLIINNTIYVTFSIIPSLLRRYDELHINDLLALILSLLFFEFLYWSFYLKPLFGKVTEKAGLLLFFIPIIYVLGYGARIFYDIMTQRRLQRQFNENIL